VAREPFSLCASPEANLEDTMQGVALDRASRWPTVLGAVWAPIPWMLEAMFVLLLALGDYAGMTAVAVLLAVNAACGLGGEGCARALKVARRAE
jgi:hypothetical protein